MDFSDLEVKITEITELLVREWCGVGNSIQSEKDNLTCLSKLAGLSYTGKSIRSVT